MSENKAKPAAAEKKEKKEVKSGRAVEQPKKPRWTLARCRRRARRFLTEDQWRAGHPSSYKSASHHGWVAECVAVMGKKPEMPVRKAA